MADAEKVITGLKCHCNVLRCCECPYYINNGVQCSDKLAKDALELLIKQMSMEVVYTENDMTGLPVAHCPSCNEHIKMTAYGSQIVQKYCPYCGQAVKWK